MNIENEKIYIGDEYNGFYIEFNGKFFSFIHGDEVSGLVNLFKEIGFKEENITYEEDY